MKTSTAQIVRNELKRAMPDIAKQTRNLIKDDLVIMKDNILDETEQMIQKQSLDFDKKLEKQTKVILESVAEVVQDGITPLIEDHETRIEKLEKHAKLLPLAS